MSLRARLLAGTAVIAVVLIAAAFIVTRTTEAHLLDRVDAQLQSAEAPVRQFGRDHGPGPGGRFGPRRPALGQPRLSSLYAASVDEDGGVVELFTPNLTEETSPTPEIDGIEALQAARTGEAYTVTSEGSDTRYRVLADRDPRTGGVMVLALPLSDVDTAVDRLLAVEVTATLAALAVLALVTWWVIHLGVRPIKRMTATATAIAGGDLSHRVPDVASGTEAGELGTALNTMLGRIEEAFDERTRSEQRLRQFVADASHELRTPVTTIRGYAELYRTGALDSSGELDEAMRRTEQEAVRMGSLVDDMLHLARVDQGRPLQREPVDLAAIADDAVRDARAVDPSRPVTLSADGDSAVLGDDARLRQVVANLVANALVHTEPGTPIEVRVSRSPSGERAVLEVVDSGAGMSEEVAARAFERFYRADPSRSRHRGGSGLGLSIVHATVAAHGGTVALRSSPGAGTTVRVELPLAL